MKAKNQDNTILVLAPKLCNIRQTMAGLFDIFACLFWIYKPKRLCYVILGWKNEIKMGDVNFQEGLLASGGSALLPEPLEKCI